VWRPSGHRVAEKRHAAAHHLRVVGAEKAGDRAQRGRLAGPVGAEERYDRARRHRERHALDRRRDVVVDDLEVLHLEEGRHDARGRHDAGRSGR
jgi:hypothetical protein